MSQPRVSNMSQVWELRAVLSWGGANSNDFTNKVIIVILVKFSKADVNKSWLFTAIAWWRSAGAKTCNL